MGREDWLYIYIYIVVTYMLLLKVAKSFVYAIYELKLLSLKLQSMNEVIKRRGGFVLTLLHALYRYTI